jgi:colicin import membrane protein
MRENRASIDSIIDSVDEAIERYGVLNALFSTSSTPSPRPPPPPPRPSVPTPEEEEYEVEDLMRVLRASWEQLTDAMVQAEKEHGTAIQEARDEVALQRAQKDQEAAEAAQAQARANADKMTQIEKDALAARQAIARDAAASSADLLQGLMSGQEKASKTIKKFLGSELQARGRAFLIEGAATIAVPGLQGKGAALLAGGAAMMAGGALLAGSGGGGGGTAVASGAAPIPSSQSAGPSTAVTNQVSFGIVGDPRAAAALVADSTRNALREGYAVGAA